jgi:hypothetical protein
MLGLECTFVGRQYPSTWSNVGLHTMRRWQCRKTRLSGYLPHHRVARSMQTLPKKDSLK